jgi:peptide/nickel transport system permease protein
MVREGIPYLAVAPWFSIFPGLAILIAILSLNMVGDGIRDIADPRLRGV